jgi:hypothetical protein
MTSGVPRDRMSRHRLVLVGAAVVALAGASLLIAIAPGVASAAPLIGAAATPTLDPLIVPTSAAGAGASSVTPAISTSSSGVEVAFVLSCVTSIAGLIIAVVTLTALIRGGYGPFLRALMPRWLRRKTNDKLPGKAEQPVLRYQPSAHGPETGFDLYAEAPSPRGPRRDSRRSASRQVARDEWQDWDAPPARQPRASQARRGSSSRASRGRY